MHHADEESGQQQPSHPRKWLYLCICLAVTGLAVVGVTVLLYFFAPDLFSEAKMMYFAVGGTGIFTTVVSAVGGYFSKKKSRGGYVDSQQATPSVVVNVGEERQSFEEHEALLRRVYEAEKRAKKAETREKTAFERAHHYQQITDLLRSHEERNLEKLTDAYHRIHALYLSNHEKLNRLTTFILDQTEITKLTFKTLMGKCIEFGFDEEKLLDIYHASLQAIIGTQETKQTLMRHAYTQVIKQLIHTEALMVEANKQQTHYLTNYRLGRGLIEVILTTQENYETHVLTFIGHLLRNAKSKREIPKAFLQEACQQLQLARTHLPKITLQVEIAQTAPIDATPARPPGRPRTHSDGERAGLPPTTLFATPHTPLHDAVAYSPSYGSLGKKKDRSRSPSPTGSDLI